MSYAVERQAIETYFAANWLTTPISYENVDFTPPAAAAWVAISFGDSDAVQIGTGATNLIRSSAVCFIDINVPAGQGLGTAETYADQIIALFAEEMIGDAQFTSPGRIINGSDGTYFQITIQAPYWRDDVR